MAPLAPQLSTTDERLWRLELTLRRCAQMRDNGARFESVIAHGEEDLAQARETANRANAEIVLTALRSVRRGEGAEQDLHSLAKRQVADVQQVLGPALNRSRAALLRALRETTVS